MSDPNHLPVLPDTSWKRVLCVVAHPDDMEYGASAAVATWTRRGVDVAYLLLTAGEAGMAEPPEVVGPIRAEEQREACRRVGVGGLTILDHPDGMLQPDLHLRHDVARVIRMYRPDAVLTMTYETEAYGSLNQADHRAAGLAVADAVRDAANTWVYRHLAELEGLPAWQTGSLVVVGHSQPTHALPVDQAAVDAAVSSLEAHEAYLRHLSGHTAPAEMIPGFLRQGGELAGAEYAVAARVFELGGPAGSQPGEQEGEASTVADESSPAEPTTEEASGPVEAAADGKQPAEATAESERAEPERPATDTPAKVASPAGV